MVLHLQQVVWHDALHHLAVPELEAHPETFHFGTGIEDASTVRLRVEFADKTDGLQVGIGDVQDGALRGKQLDACKLQERNRIYVTGERFAVESPDDRLLGCGAGHCAFMKTMFQTFRRLLYHWHDVGSAYGGRRTRWPDRRISPVLPRRKGSFGQLHQRLFG